MLKDNKVPILLQDPIALMIHFILLLPVNVDLGKKQTSNIKSKDPNKNTKILYYQKSKPLLKMRIVLQEFHHLYNFKKITFHEVNRKN